VDSIRPNGISYYLKTSYLLIFTKLEIIFHRSAAAARNISIPSPLPGIERVKQATLLGIDAADTLSTAAYVDRLRMQVNQRSSLHLLFNALVINKLTYALPAYAGELTVDDKTG